MRTRRETSAFNIAFLDIMCCGFGAVVLLVMILNGKTLEKREETENQLAAQIERVTLLKEFADSDLKRVQNDIAAIDFEESTLQAQAQATRARIMEEQQKKQQSERDSSQRQATIKAMQKEKSKLDAEQKNSQVKSTSGEKLIGFDGEGKRQYLTGLKLGGKRTLILLDASSSMLDETVVNVIRRKFLNEDARRQSPKWIRAVRSLHWLVSNLQPGNRFQIYYFNTEPHPLLENTDGRWLDTSDANLLSSAIAAARSIAPHKGTNLHAAFQVVRKMKPKPDNVILLTDGLPTQGSERPIPYSVTGLERLELFERAVAQLPKKVPINTLLFPIEGDPFAAASFWGLAVATNGSFISPARDWP